MLFNFFEEKTNSSQKYIINTDKGYLIYDNEEISFTDNWAIATSIDEDIFVYHREDIRVELLEKFNCELISFQMI